MPIFAQSIDILPTDTPCTSGPNKVLVHLQQDVISFLSDPLFDPTHWDILVAFPPCTHLAVSGARWFPKKQKEQQEAIDFVYALWNCGINRICIENPVSILSSYLGKPTQIVHPYMFGHTEIKRTCLWLKNLPRIKPTNVITKGRTKNIYNKGESKDRWKYRSKTFAGLAQAMATQWTLDKLLRYDRIQENRKSRSRRA
jgi:hypothetical protein